LGADNRGWRYKARPTDGGNYRRLGLYDLLFATDSTLALEALSMGYLVIFLEVGDACDVRIPLGYPQNIVEKGSGSLLEIQYRSEWAAQISAMIRISQVDKQRLLRDLIGAEVLETDSKSVKSIISKALRG
jgi:hypothetical protein